MTGQACSKKHAVETQRLGESSLKVSALGIGAWAWGDTRLWRYGIGYGLKEVEEAFQASLEAGINFFDTAEIYGGGVSESILGRLVRESGSSVVVATKFAPLPWRFNARAVHRALEGSLKRLGMDHVDLYQVHFPHTVMKQETLMNSLADLVESGKVRAIGVSNYSDVQMRRAHDLLARRGIPLASNQVEYSLLKRSPEANRVLQACRELNITLIAYSPLAMGVLSGKYRPDSNIRGLRRFRRNFRGRGLRAAMPVVSLLEEIAAAHARTPAQVALNWLLRQEAVVPIPGAKDRRQASENAGAVGWSISDEEAEALDQATLPWRR